jgi:hypothetical protein
MNWQLRLLFEGMMEELSEITENRTGEKVHNVYHIIPVVGILYISAA